MKKQIVIPVDYSEIGHEMALMGDEWASQIDGHLHFLHVSKLPEASYYPGHFEHVDQRDETKELQRLNTYLSDLNLKSDYDLSHEYGTPYLKIVEMSNKLNADLVIMAAHSHTMLDRLFLGSNTDYVVHHVHCPVFVHKKIKQPAENIIIVPLDFSDANVPVVEEANNWATLNNSELHFVHIMMPVDYSYYGAEASWGLSKAEFDLTEDKGMEAMDNFLANTKITAQEKRVVVFGSSSYLRLLEYQQEVNARLIMLAGNDHSAAGRLFLGSNTDYLLHHTEIPMYVFKKSE